MRRHLLLLSVAAALGAAASRAEAATAEIVDRTALRVCADPSNLPFSNQAGEGFENKIAELLAEDLGVPVQYTWFPQATGFVRNTLNARRCDIVIGISLGFELLQNTNPYYRSAYALVYRADSGLSVTALDDPALKARTIGVVAGTPPASLIARYGLLAQVRSYPLMVDTRYESSGQRMVDDVAAGEVDVGVLWGPIAGYYSKRHNPLVTVVPLRSRPGELKMDYWITMGVRFNEPDWKHRINDFIARRRADIDSILADFGVPLLDDKGDPLEPVRTATVAVPEPEGYRMEGYRAPTPAGIAGGRTVSTAEVQALVDSKRALLIDVLPRPPKPEGLAEGTIWRHAPRHNIPGSVWLANTGFGALSLETERYFRASLDNLTEGDKSRALVIYCEAGCWMSWNAAKRAISYGYGNVLWYPEGTDGWTAAGLPTQEVEPLPLPIAAGQ